MNIGRRLDIRGIVFVVVAVFVLLAAGPVRAAVDDSSPSIGWRPTGGIVYAIERVGDMVVVGGTFTAMVSPDGATTVARNRIAALDAATGALLPWSPSANGVVYAITGSPDGSTVYAGGLFTAIGGAARTNLAALSATTGLATAFTAAPNADVRDLLYSGSSLYVGGIFSRVNGTSRGGGAELDPTTGALRTWNPRTNWGVYSISAAADGTSMWVGGPFSTVSGTPQEFIAKVSRSTGALLPWSNGSTCNDPNNRCVVYDTAVTADTLYLAQGGPGGRVTSLDPATGTQRWWSGGDGDCQTILVDGDKIYAGGHWDTAFSGVTRAGLVVLNRHTGAVLPDIDAAVIGSSGVWDITKDGSTLRFGGQFTTIDGRPIGRLSSFPILPDPPDTTPPAQPTTLRAPAVLDRQVSLSWNASSDNVATIAYEILRGGSVIGSTSTTRFKDGTVTPGTSVSYAVRAVDSSGNRSAATPALAVQVPAAANYLIPLGATWKYSSSGLLPSADWMLPGASDASWSTGAGEFGFGDGDEATYIAPRGVAHYFRTQFNVADPAAVTSATLRILLDDGAVVYLNGTELLRQGMPTGTVGNDTLATAGIGGNTEMVYTSYSVAPSALVAGANTLAVEVHNQALTSSDISFDAVLSAVLPAPPAQPPAAPTGLAGSASSNAVALTWNAVSGATSYTVLRDGAPIGTSTTPAYTDGTVSAQTTYSYQVVAGNAAGSGPASAAITVTTPAVPQPPTTPTGLAVTSTTSSSVGLRWDAVAGATSYVVSRNGTALPAVSGTTTTDTGLQPASTYTYTVAAVNSVGSSGPSGAVSATTTSAPIASYVLSGDVWRYNDSGADLGTGWRNPTYDDTAWKSGGTQLGYGDGDERTVLTWGANAAAKPITNYARIRFYAGEDVQDVTSLALRAIVDDGAAVYLNGTEVWRFNLPTGTITATTRASTYIAGSAESTWRTASLPVGALQPGWNTLAVEVHQDTPSSSDVSLDVELRPVR